jgi:hypothetical protein
MFLNKIKDFCIKKIVNKRLSNVKHINSDSSIKKVGIVFDETYFYEKEKLMEQLIKNGIYSENTKFLVFRDRVKKNETFDYKVFTYKNINWNATFDNQDVNDFINEDFDLLISYYDIEKTPLLVVTNRSKAKFKVGFSSIDNRLNHFMIDTNAENYVVFINELFKYLKILNKL